MTYARPGNLDEALEVLADERWSVLAGGTDFYPALQGCAVSGNVLDIQGLAELADIRTGYISRDETYTRLGALLTWSSLIAADLPAAFDSLKLAAREVGSVQIQNRATIAGNICNASPAADGMPPLLILDALVELSSLRGTRTVPLNEFVTGNRRTLRQPDELVSAILIPEDSTYGHSTFRKLGARKYLVISISMVAARLMTDANGRIHDSAISVGSCSVVAQRLSVLEEALQGQIAGPDLLQLVRPEMLEALTPIDDVRATGQYRLAASLELVQRALYDLLNTETAA